MMMDPRQQQKRGFGAFVAREHEETDARAAAVEHATADPSSAPTTEGMTTPNATAAPTAGVTPATGSETRLRS